MGVVKCVAPFWVTHILLRAIYMTIGTQEGTTILKTFHAETYLANLKKSPCVRVRVPDNPARGIARLVKG